jgi:peptidoglycan/LPS O-acetylase OafA/YrhL
MTTAAEAYSIVGLVLWLTAAGFIVGLLVSVVTQKRASLWSVVTVAAFLVVIAAIAVTAAGTPMPLSIAFSGGFLVLTATATGGWIGQEIWRRALRPPTPPG